MTYIGDVGLVVNAAVFLPDQGVSVAKKSAKIPL
jgi:hypothetical protein